MRLEFLCEAAAQWVGAPVARTRLEIRSSHDIRLIWYYVCASRLGVIFDEKKQAKHKPEKSVKGIVKVL